MVESDDGREVDDGLLVSIPLHFGSEAIQRSPGLGDDFGFLSTDKHTLQAKAVDHIFALGDAAQLPSSKAGAAARCAGCAGRSV